MDHEASGAQEWQLPGYGRTNTKTRAFSSVASQSQAAQQPRIAIVKPEKKRQQLPSTPVVIANPSKNPGISRGGLRGRSRGGLTARGLSYRAGQSSQSIHLFRDSPAKSKWRNGLEPTASVKLPAAFGTFKHELLAVARGRKFSGVLGRNEVFEDISRKTGAYVKPPAYTDQVIYLWGEHPQVAAAQEHLRWLIAKCNGPSQKKRADWTKIKSYSVSKEADADFKEKRDIMIHHLRKAPDSSSAFPEKLLFMWPKDGPSLNESLGPQLEALDIIRAKFGCHLFVPKDLPGYICGLGYNHDDLKQIAQRIRTLWGEIIAKTNIKSKVYIVEPPKPDSMRSKIVVKKQSHLHKATLRGNLLNGPEQENWRSRVDLIQNKNNTRILKAVENSLRGLSFVRGHLRMRVNLGSFVLDNYQIPDNDKPWYSFEEFREMLLHEQTKGRLIPGLKVSQGEFLERCFKATDLLEPYESTSTSLERADLAFSVNFEFLGSDKSMLRLEAEFARSPGAQDYEITQRRWLRPRASGQAGDKRSPLQIAITDFGRQALEFYETSSIDTALKTFSHSIGFRRTANIDDISARPERKVIFPVSAPVSRFVEKSAIRYRLKGTKYILEIARYDEYGRTDVTGQISDVPCTSWGASIFDPNWDNLLGGHANLSVGHSAKYTPNPCIFFPSKNLSSLEGKSQGFWEFIDLVKQVANLLGPTRIPSEPTEGLEDVGRRAASTETFLLTSAAPKSGAIASPISPTDSTHSTKLMNEDLGTLF